MKKTIKKINALEQLEALTTIKKKLELRDKDVLEKLKNVLEKKTPILTLLRNNSIVEPSSEYLIIKEHYKKRGLASEKITNFLETALVLFFLQYKINYKSWEEFLENLNQEAFLEEVIINL